MRQWFGEEATLQYAGGDVPSCLRKERVRLSGDTATAFVLLVDDQSFWGEKNGNYL